MGERKCIFSHRSLPFEMDIRMPLNHRDVYYHLNFCYDTFPLFNHRMAADDGIVC